MVGWRKNSLLRALAAAALLLAAGSGRGAAAQPAAASDAEAAVDLALVLAVDASGSITDDRWDLERQGYAHAFRDPEVIKAITSGSIGAVAVTLFEWSGEFQQSPIVGWTRISDAQSAGRFADLLAEMPHNFRSWTSIRAALAYGAQLLATVPYDASRRVIDVSGDGPDSTSEIILQGTRADLDGLVATRDRLVGQGLIINGLPILGDPRIRSIDLYYDNSVRGGPGSFDVVAEDFTVFGQAVRRKLILEIAGRAPDATVVPAVAD
jgi:hypothetical protein